MDYLSLLIHHIRHSGSISKNTLFALNIIVDSWDTKEFICLSYLVSKNIENLDAHCKKHY